MIAACRSFVAKGYKENEGDGYPLSFMCIKDLCTITYLRDSMCLCNVIVSGLFLLIGVALCFVHTQNFLNNKTTHERFARNNRTASEASDDDSSSATTNTKKNAGKIGKCSNIKSFCCGYKFPTQEQLYEKYKLESGLSEDGTESAYSRRSSIVSKGSRRASIAKAGDVYQAGTIP